MSHEHGDGSHTHHGHEGGGITISAGGMAVLAVTVLLIAHPKQLNGALETVAILVLVILVLALAALIAASLLTRRHYESEVIYRTRISPPGRLEAMLAEQVQPARRALPSPQRRVIQGHREPDTTQPLPVAGGTVVRPRWPER